jgi:hypothetical protein
MARHRGAHTVRSMSSITSAPSQRELVDELLMRLERIRAEGTTIGSLTSNSGTSSVVLAEALHELEHDLVLATRAAETAAAALTRPTLSKEPS